MKTRTSNKPLTWVEIDLQALRHNLHQIRKLAAKDKFYLPTRRGGKYKALIRPRVLPVIKADGYGHGMDQIARVLEQEKIEMLGVSDVAEGVHLRKTGIRRPILLLESTLPQLAEEVVTNRLIPTVCTIELARALQHAAEKYHRRVPIHIKVDTGMGRLGVRYEDAFDFVREVHQFRRLIIQGIYTHFPSADTHRSFTQEQIDQMYRLVIRLDKTGLVIPFVHAANSTGLVGYRNHVLNLARPGLMLYGLYPDKKLRTKIDLHPVMTVKSRIIYLKEINKGDGVSYGRTFVAKKRMLTATIPIGYSDGYFRSFTEKASVLVKGRRCPVIGRVTMDQIVVDVSSVKEVVLGETVTILGKDRNNEITAEELAGYAGTINYEIVCSLGNRIPRVFV